MFQLCLSRYVLITLCILVLSFEFDFVWSTCYFPVYFVCKPCLVLIKYYYLSLRPRLRVPVPPLCVHRDTRSYATILTYSVHGVRTVCYLGLCVSMDSLTLTFASFSQRFLAEAQDDINILLEQMKTVT